MADVDRV